MHNITAAVSGDVFVFPGDLTANEPSHADSKGTVGHPYDAQRDALLKYAC